MRSEQKTETTTKAHAKEKSALELLKADHEKVTQMFEEYEETHTASKKRKLATEICEALSVHAQVEEELFYPEVKAALKDKTLVPEATVEHAVMKELIAQIESDEEGGEMYDATIKVLSEYVKHHIKEEQGELFRKVKQSSLDMAELGERMAARFEDLRAAKH